MPPSFFVSLRSSATSASLRYLFLLFFFFSSFFAQARPKKLLHFSEFIHTSVQLTSITLPLTMRPRCKTGNRSSPDNRPRHLKKITEQRIPCKLNLARQKGSVLS